jgi:hypothetical protein
MNDREKEKHLLFVERRLEINNYDKLRKINGKSSEKENGKSIDN